MVIAVLGNTQMRTMVCDLQPVAQPYGTIFQQNNSSQIQFELKNMLCDIPKKMFLKLELSNSDGSNPLSLPPSQILFNNLFIRMNEQDLDNIQGIQLLMDMFQFQDFTEFDQVALAARVNPSTFRSSLSIPASSTVTVMFPLLINLCNQSIPMNLFEKISTKLIFVANGGSGLLVNSGSGYANITSLSLTNVSLRIYGHQFMKDSDREALRSTLRASPVVYRSLYHQFNPFNTAGTLSNGAITNIQPNFSIRKCAAVQLCVMNNSPTGAGLYVPNQLLKWNISNSGSESKTGLPTSINISDLESRYIINSNEQSLWLNPLYVYQYPFAGDLKKSFMEGVDTGSCELIPSDRLQFQPENSAQYLIYITNLNYGLVTIYPSRQIKIDH